jgi:A/G-specific adenine glycosylase
VSFAFDIPAPIVEANTLRLYSRLLGYDGDPRATDGQRLLWEFAERLLPRRRVNEFNQALIDLGATVCLPTEPECHRCPLRTCCAAFRTGRQQMIPRTRSPVAATDVTEATVAVRKQGAYLLRRRGDSERWAGLWDFPRFEITDGAGFPKSAQGNDRLTVTQSRRITAQVWELTGIRIHAPVALATLRHSVTRYRITLNCLHAEYASGRLNRSSPPMRWVRPRYFEQFPLSVTGRKLASQISDGVGR